MFNYQRVFHAAQAILAHISSMREHKDTPTNTGSRAARKIMGELIMVGIVGFGQPYYGQWSTVCELKYHYD